MPKYRVEATIEVIQVFEMEAETAKQAEDMVEEMSLEQLLNNDFMPDGVSCISGSDDLVSVKGSLASEEE